jgi:hypothetical protein
VKIVLHMGQSKTGTSSLQKSLHLAAATLRQAKVYYPDFGHGFDSHPLLLALCGQAHRIPPWRLEWLGGPDGAVQAAERAWEQTCAGIRNDPPDLLVLSSEFLLHQVDGPQKALLAKLLSALSHDITPVIYVRHPQDHYRARLQQRMKSWDHPFPPHGPTLQAAVLETEAAFGRPANLIAFDRGLLQGGDIVRDFAARYLSPWVTPADLPEVTTNVGLSAEALVLMAHLRAEAGGSYQAARQVAKLVPELEALDQSIPPSQPFTLLPEVAEAALRAAVGHRWLAETGRLQIPGLDISRIDGAPVPDWMTTAPPATLFQHDPDRLARLRQAIRQSSRRKAPPKPPSVRLADQVARFLRRKLSNYPGRPTRSDRRS